MTGVPQAWAGDVNTAITASDPRGDWRPAYGSQYMTSAVETVVAAQNTPVKALGTTAGGDTLGMTRASNNKLSYIEESGGVFTVTVTFSVESAAAD